MALKAGLYKKEKLCSEVAIARLFSHDGNSASALAYPLRAIWRHNPGRRSDAPVQFLISVPKKRLHHAVDRVKIRRRVREAYRLNKHLLTLPEGARYDLAFLYLDNSQQPYQRIEKAVCRLLESLSNACQSTQPAQ